jgi:hypothetical protein
MSENVIGPGLDEPHVAGFIEASEALLERALAQA